MLVIFVKAARTDILIDSATKQAPQALVSDASFTLGGHSLDLQTLTTPWA